jgi:tetratricopeptide (TPR) repeat protein
MFCTACGTKNASDANFCKQCGRRIERNGAPKITEDAFAEAGTADEQVRSYLARAYDMYEAGDLMGAIECCAKALGVQPNSTDAHSLLSTLYEKQGDRERAIAEREIVLQLNPGSIADREKLEQLRDSALVITPRKITTSRPTGGSILDSRAGAAVIAVAITLFVMVAGLAAVLMARSRTPAAQARSNQSPGIALPNRGPIVASNNLPQNPISSVQQPAPVNPRVTVSGWPQAAPQPSANASHPAPTFAPREEDMPVRQIPPATVRIPSANERFQSSFDPQNSQPSRSTAAGNTIHLPDNGLSPSELGPPPVNTQTAPQPATPAPPKNHGKIEIIVSNNPNAGRGSQGSAPAIRNTEDSSTMDSRNLKRVAQDYQFKGQYKLAISNYIKALDGAGDDAASLHYQIGLCYQRLDERDSAIAQYNAAIAAYKQMAASGQNVDSANRGIRAAEAGIKACQ